MKSYSNYTDFLKDEEFIRWQLLPDEMQETYWESFIAQNPEQRSELNRAIRYLKSTGLNANLLSPDNEQQMLHRIKHSLADNRKKQHMRRLYYFSLAASIAVLITVGSVMFFQKSRNMGTLGQQPEFIVGNLLNNKDIQIITGEGKAISFKNDVQAQVDEKGNALKVTDSENAETTLNMNQNTMNKLVVPYGKRTQLTLADGTRIWLNSGSMLEFPAVFDGKTREIRVSGEIYIEVAKNVRKPFYVHTPTFSVNVFGTSFNVNSYLNAPAEVVLVEGSIAIETTGGKKTTGAKLKPGEMATLVSGNAIEKKEVDVSKYTSWKDGYIVLFQTPVSEALQRIERLYNLSFDMGNSVNLKNKHCYGKLVLSENLDDVLNTLAALSGTVYERNDKTIIIRNKEIKTSE